MHRIQGGMIYLSLQGILSLSVQSRPQHMLALLFVVVLGVSTIEYHVFQYRKLATRRGVKLLKMFCHTTELIVRKSNMKHLFVVLHLVFDAGCSNYASDYIYGLDRNHLNGKAEARFKHMGVEIHSEYASNCIIIENSDIGSGSYGPAIEKSTGDLVMGGKYSCTSMAISLRDTDMSSHNVNRIESSIYQNPDVVYETSEDYAAMQPNISVDDSLLFDFSSQYVPDCFDLQFMPSNKEILINMKDENEKLSS